LFERDKWTVTIDSVDDGQQQILIVSANFIALKIAAERFNLRKKCNSVPPFQPFNCDNEADFIKLDEEENFFTKAEQLFLLRKSLDSFRASATDKIIPGHQEAALYKGKSIIRRLLSSGIVSHVQPSHDRETLKKLRGSWLKSFNPKNIVSQPIADLDAYFGTELGLYFQFVEHYAVSLFWLILIILTMRLTGISKGSRLISLGTIVWSFMWIYQWRKRQVDRAYRNGTLNSTDRGWEEARPHYHGPLSHNQVTGEEEPNYPTRKYYVKCSLSYFISGFCCFLAYQLMLFYYAWEKWTYDEFGMDSYIAMAPGILYTIVVIITSQLYRKLARNLTNWENHRTERQYQHNLLVKLVVFEFINNFLVLYFLAFIYNDIQMLRSTVITTMTVSQLFVELFEGYIPFLMYRKRTKSKSKKFDTIGNQMKYESLRDEYEGEFEEYLEIWIQFGYVTLFTCIYEWAPIVAFIATIIEIRNDAHKFCNLFQRPQSAIAEHIGFWDDAFSLLAFLSIPTSVGIAAMKGEADWTHAIVLEHVVIFLCVFINRIRPVPAEIQLALDKDDYYKLTQNESRIRAKVGLKLD